MADAEIRNGAVLLHTLLCVGALATVLAADWRVLHGNPGRGSLLRLHRRMALWLAGLWASGLVLIAIDTGFDPALLLQKPKLHAKLACVALLTLNALALRHFALPRLPRRERLAAWELRAVAAFGAVSTASWLMAAAIGLAKPMAHWTTAQTLGLHAAVLAGAVAVAVAAGPRLLALHRARPRVAALPPQGTSTAAP